MYDYAGGVSHTLAATNASRGADAAGRDRPAIQEGQIVNLIEKTSADCKLSVWACRAPSRVADVPGWTCEDGNGRRGLIPAAYLKEY